MSLWQLLESAAAVEASQQGLPRDEPEACRPADESPAPGLPAVELAPEGDRIVDSACFGQLRVRALALAATLAARGVRAGDRVALLADNGIAFAVVSFAAARLGAILVPLNTRLRSADWAEVLTLAEARVLLAGPDYIELARDAARSAQLAHLLWLGGQPIPAPVAPPAPPAPVGADTPAQLYFTSGSTGRPKGVVLTHGNIATHAHAAVRELALDSSTVWGHIAPMFHLADAWATFALPIAGGRQVFLPRFEARAVVAAVELERITTTNLIPTMLARVLVEPSLTEADLSSLQLVLTGGAPIARSTVRRAMQQLGCEYAQTYGMTETSPYLTLSLLPEHLLALPFEAQLEWRSKTGRPFAAVELRVVDEAGRAVPPDGESIGEIQARGPTVTPGYWRDPETTRQAFDGDWLCTGDLATLDAEGFLDIVDRKADMIVTGGENVHSIEVERALHTHPAVLEAAVYGVPHEEWGELVEAAVVLDRGGYGPGGCEPGPGAPELPDAAALIEHCRAELARYKVPKRIRILEELPRLGSGKIAKRELREAARAR